MVDKPFILIAKQRSGSTWLADLLNNHPAIKMYGELLLWRKRNSDIRLDEFPGFYETAAGLSFGRQQLEVIRYLDCFYNQDAESAGFKLMYSQIRQFPLLWFYLRRRKITVLHLVRCNYLDSIISLETALAKKQFHSDRILGEAAPKNGIWLNPQRTLKRIKSLEYQDQFIERALRLFGMKTGQFRYEALCENTAAIMTDIYTFLGLEIPAQLTHSNLRKLIITKHQDSIQNYAELKNCLANTRYARLLKD